MRIPKHLMQRRLVWDVKKNKLAPRLHMSDELEAWVNEHAPMAKFFHHYSIVNAHLTFGNDGELALFKLTWL